MPTESHVRGWCFLLSGGRALPGCVGHGTKANPTRADGAQPLTGISAMAAPSNGAWVSEKAALVPAMMSRRVPFGPLCLLPLCNMVQPRYQGLGRGNEPRV